ncbi:MAG: 50S ribosomal protein L25/general stress protein Ctc [Campylobacteraceae bacterium]|nr:50S ribosomal protein L25/general stress protein Ctc [Campylobacteraceae bacterium]
MLEGILRNSIVKQATKQYRRDGYLIANIYGKGLENINAIFKMNDYIRALKSKETIAFDVTVDGKTHNVVVKEYQKHPVTSTLLHVDLMIAQPGVIANYHIPVKTTGDAIGVKNKGLLFVQTKRVPVRCTIEDLPQDITFDVTNLDTGDNILVRDLELAENVKCFLDPRVPIVGIIKAK